jgi:hypothetical protein
MGFGGRDLEEVSSATSWDVFNIPTLGLPHPS